MNRKNLLFVFALSALCCSACNTDDIVVSYNGGKAKVKQEKLDSVKVKVDGAKVEIKSEYKSRELKVRLSGKTDDGSLLLKGDGKAQVTLDNVSITSNEGAPICFKTKKRAEIIAADGTKNSLVITACKDTANNKQAVIWANSKLVISGSGTIDATATGDGCKGINCKKNIEINDVTLNVTTKGNHLGKKQGGFGFGGGMPGPPPDFNFDNLPDSVKAMIEDMRKRMENGDFSGFPGGPMGGPMGGGPMGKPGEGGPGGFPGGPMGGPGEEQGGFGGFPGGPMGGFGGFGGGMASGDPDLERSQEGFKQKFIATPKGIKSLGIITINSGKVTVYTTAAGSEGLEGKKGVIINGGEVVINANDDAINANGQIFFNGGKTIAESRNNDAVDANYGDGMLDFGNPFMMGGNQQKKEDKEVTPAIVISGGEVYAWNHTGAPEEGLDCDFTPIAISAGKVFTTGGGMGEMPSVPTNATAKQPTLLLLNLNITKNEAIEFFESDAKGNAIGSALYSVNVPFNFNNSASIVSCPDFKVGKTYTAKTKDYTKTFKIEENFTVVR